MVTRFKHWFYIKSLFFGAVKLSKNADSGKYSYSGYGTGFDSQSLSLIANFDFGKNVIFWCGE